MAFKVANLKKWTVKRDVKIDDEASITLTIAIKKRSEYEEIANKGVDLETAKFLVTGIDGLQDDNGKDLDIKHAWDVIADYPAIVFAVTQKAIDAQYTAAVKN